MLMSQPQTNTITRVITYWLTIKPNPVISGIRMENPNPPNPNTLMPMNPATAGMVARTTR